MPPRKRSSKKLFENKSFNLMKNLHKLIAWETEILRRTALHLSLEVHVSSRCPLVSFSSVGRSIHSLAFPPHLQRLPVVLFRINCRDLGGGQKCNFLLTGFARFITYQFCERCIVSGCEALPCYTCSCLSNEAKSVDNPGLANWMFCNGDSWIITISRSKSVTRRCSGLVGFSVWLYNHR